MNRRTPASTRERDATGSGERRPDADARAAAKPPPPSKPPAERERPVQQLMIAWTLETAARVRVPVRCRVRWIVVEGIGSERWHKPHRVYEAGESVDVLSVLAVPSFIVLRGALIVEPIKQ
jgi:hypothetical protein